MDAESRAAKWRQVIQEKLLEMQGRRQQFSDLAGWRAAIGESESSGLEKWWLDEFAKFEAMLDDAASALRSIPELTPRRTEHALSCVMASGAVRSLGVVRFGRELATVRALGTLERGTLRWIQLPADAPVPGGGHARWTFSHPQLPPSAEQTLFIEAQVEKRIELFLQWVASGAAVERWEQGE